MAEEAVPAPWVVERCSDHADSRSILIRPGLKLIVIDDRDIDESTRGWLLDQIHRHARGALIAYIASSHSEEAERSIRAHQVHYYTSRPIDRDRTGRVIASFANASTRGS
ncbi:MAG TPA: hypothetical protein VMU16_07145 [Candidatus Binataceae bacterium]|nr:hypothetical protein [Candidatus Binataceae bacterium]